MRYIPLLLPQALELLLDVQAQMLGLKLYVPALQQRRFRLAMQTYEDISNIFWSPNDMATDLPRDSRLWPEATG